MITSHTALQLKSYDNMGYDSTPIPNSLCFCGTEKSIQSALKNPNVAGIITTERLAKMYDTDHKILYTHPTPKSYFWQVWQGQHPPTAYTKPNIIAPDIIFDGPVHMDTTGITIGNNVKIGAFTVLKSGTTIGDNVTIGANCVLGGESLQTFEDNNIHTLVKHRGALYIKNNITILDGTIINRGVFTYHPTVIENHCIIDNNVTIAHGCHIGKNTQIAPAVQLCGRVTVGENTFIGASVTVLNNTHIGKDCHIGIGEKIFESVTDKTRITIRGTRPN